MQLGSLALGDLILVDRGGRLFHAKVTAIFGRDLQFRPLCKGISFRTCTSHEVKGIWRANAETRRRFPADPPPSA